MAAIDPVQARVRVFLCVAGLTFLSSAVLSQDVKKPAPKLADTHHEAESDDPHEGMKRLMRRVEQRLFEIDKLLTNAGAGEGGSAVIDAAAHTKAAPETITGPGALVRQSQDESRAAVRDIDRILELADHPHPPGAA
jgi:hypothetical protein